jgi:hypothetical protein
VSVLKLNMFNLVAIFRVLINRISKKRINEAISNYVGKELARIWSPLLPSPHEVLVEESSDLWDIAK